MQASLALAAPDDLMFGDLVIKTDSRQVMRSGKKIPLRRKEFELLEFLARNCERVLNRLTILEYVWNYSAHSATNTLDVHMTSLRKKIDRNFDKKLIRTVHGLGYKLSLEE